MCAADQLGVCSECGDEETFAVRVQLGVMLGFRMNAKGMHGVESEKHGEAI